LFALDRDVVGFSWLYEPFVKRLEYFLMPLNVFVDTVSNTWTFQSATVLFWAVFLVIVVVGGWGKDRATLFPAALVAALLVFSTLVFPSMIAESSGAPRLAYPAAFALLALLPAGWDGRPALRAIVMLLCMLHPIGFAFGVARFQNEMADFEKVI